MAKSDARAASAFILGVLIGIVVSMAITDIDEDSIYRRGHNAGWTDAMDKCNGPSRLEKAAKWIAR